VELDFEDLIGRKKREVRLSADEISFFRDMTIAITGGAGSIGASLANQLLKETNSKIYLIDSDESRLHTFFVNLPLDFRSRTETYLADVRDSYSIKTALSKIDPKLVIHAAALKHVSVLESVPREAFLTNVIGTYNVLRSLLNSNVKHFVFVSTDKAANPVGILGKTKLIGEYLTAGSILLNKEINFGVVRFGNVFLSRGSVLETFIAQLRLSEDLTITNQDMDRFFIDLDEASSLILKTIVEPHSGVSILKMGDPVKILDLAKRLLSKVNKPNGYRIIGTKPGEKITEELFTSQETLNTTEYPEYKFANFTRSIDPEIVSFENFSTDEDAIRVIDSLLRNSNEI
jgi:FlaA1/EpsC-like NDP-sugar epimerase